MEICLCKDNAIELSQSSFYNKVPALEGKELIRDNKSVRNSDKTARVLRSFVGSCIWLFQTRYDILFEVCNLAPNIITACSSIEDMKLFIKEPNAVHKKIIIEHHLPLKYSPLPLAREIDDRN